MTKNLLFAAAIAVASCGHAAAQATADFEGVVPADSFYWCGLTDTDLDYATTTFRSGDFEFTNSYMPAYLFWGGFAVSESTASTFDANNFATDQFNSVPGGAFEGRGFCLAFTSMALSEIRVLASEDGADLGSIRLANSAYFYSSAAHGDAFSQPFAQGDFHKVVFTSDNGNSVEHYLADFRDTDPAKHFIATDWQSCDLSPLGRTKVITVDIQSSNDFVPGYICMDHLTYAASEGISSAVADIDAPAEYFDLQGRPVAAPTRGIYIMRRGSTVTKIAL